MYPTIDYTFQPAKAPMAQGTRGRLLRESSARVASAMAQAAQSAHAAQATQAAPLAATEPKAPSEQPQSPTSTDQRDKHSDKLIRLQSLLTEFLHA
jgi:hypothetical protein